MFEFCAKADLLSCNNLTPPPPPPPQKKFKLNPLRLLYFIQEGFIGQFCDCLQI